MFTKISREIVEVVLWINLGLCIIVGYNIGSYTGVAVNSFTKEATGEYPIIGMIVGGFLGVMFNILYGGLIATILKVNENLENVVAVNAAKINNGKDKDCEN